MAHLFSPLTVKRAQLRNRIVLAASPSGYAAPDGRVSDLLVTYHQERASGGVALSLIEPALVVPPAAVLPHLAIYSDETQPGLQRLARAIHAEGALALLVLHAPVGLIGWSRAQLEHLRDAYVAAARRARAAGMAGVVLPISDGGPLHQLVSPHLNNREDDYGGDLEGRLRLALETVEGMRGALGPSGLLGLRLAVEISSSGDVSLNDSRVIARRLAAAGVALIDVTMQAQPSTVLARFPGWRVPLAASLRPTLDVPVMVGGGLDDPLLADSVIRDGSVDLVVVGRALQQNPRWPQQALQAIAAERRDLGFSE